MANDRQCQRCRSRSIAIAPMMTVAAPTEQARSSRRRRWRSFRSCSARINLWKLASESRPIGGISMPRMRLTLPRSTSSKSSDARSPNSSKSWSIELCLGSHFHAAGSADGFENAGKARVPDVQRAALVFVSSRLPAEHPDHRRDSGRLGHSIKDPRRVSSRGPLVFSSHACCLSSEGDRNCHGDCSFLPAHSKRGSLGVGGVASVPVDSRTDRLHRPPHRASLGLSRAVIYARASSRERPAIPLLPPILGDADRNVVSIATIATRPHQVCRRKPRWCLHQIRLRCAGALLTAVDRLQRRFDRRWSYRLHGSSGTLTAHSSRRRHQPGRDPLWVDHFTSPSLRPTQRDCHRGSHRRLGGSGLRREGRTQDRGPDTRSAYLKPFQKGKGDTSETPRDASGVLSGHVRSNFSVSPQLWVARKRLLTDGE